jgi:hypothetical protein
MSATRLQIAETHMQCGAQRHFSARYPYRQTKSRPVPFFIFAFIPPKRPIAQVRVFRFATTRMMTRT